MKDKKKTTKKDIYDKYSKRKPGPPIILKCDDMNKNLINKLKHYQRAVEILSYGSKKSKRNDLLNKYKVDEPKIQCQNINENPILKTILLNLWKKEKPKKVVVVSDTLVKNKTTEDLFLKPIPGPKPNIDCSVLKMQDILEVVKILNGLSLLKEEENIVITREYFCNNIYPKYTEEIITILRHLWKKKQSFVSSDEIVFKNDVNKNNLSQKELFLNHNDEILSVYENPNYFSDSDGYTKIIPTFECPWSKKQLIEALGEQKIIRRYELINEWIKNSEMRENLSKMFPKYLHFFHDNRFLDDEKASFILTKQNEPTIYVPFQILQLQKWLNCKKEETIEKFIQLWHEENNNDDFRALSNYIKKGYLKTEPVSKLRYIQECPFDEMLLPLLENQEDDEFSEQDLRELFAFNTLFRTYDLINSAPNDIKQSTTLITYHEILKILEKNEMGLYLIPGGYVFLEKNGKMLNELKENDFECQYISKIGNNWKCSDLISDILRNCKSGSEKTKEIKEMISKSYHSQDIREREEEEEEENKVLEIIQEEEKETTKKNRGLAEFMKSYRIKINAVHYFLHQMFYTEKKYMKTLLKYWNVETEKQFKQLMEKRQTWTLWPILSDTVRYQRKMLTKYKNFVLDPVSENPSTSNCGGDQKKKKNTFLTLDGAQLFLSTDFSPDCPFRGKIVVHSVGSGKTCLAVKIGCRFAKAGYRIIWVTKTTLKNQVLKNHVSEICNTMIKQKYDYIRLLKGEDEANQWLSQLPILTEIKSVIDRLYTEFGIEWDNISYRQLTNALDTKNNMGRAMNRRNKEDVLKNTLLIIDEAHKMFTGELDRTEMPDVNLLYKKLQESYKNSGYESVRIVFLTATPMIDSPLPLLNMINMLHKKDYYPKMKTIDPAQVAKILSKTDQGTIQKLNEYYNEIEEYNKDLEIKIACEMFQNSFSICGDVDVSKKKGKKNDKEDDEEDEAMALDFFSTNNIMNISGNQLKVSKLRNSVKAFWKKCIGLISYYNISNDYSRFPRTEFQTIIIPSATILQESFISSELANVELQADSFLAKKILKKLATKIRHIAIWAKFEGEGQPSRKPNTLDIAIINENEKTRFFESSLENLLERKNNLLNFIAIEQAQQPRESDIQSVEYNNRMIEEVDKIIHHLDRKIEELEMSGTATKEEIAVKKGQRTKKINERQKYEYNKLVFQKDIDFVETQKQLRITYYTKKLEHVEYLIERAKENQNRRNNINNDLKANLKNIFFNEQILKETKNELDNNENDEGKKNKKKKMKEQIEDDDEEEYDEKSIDDVMDRKQNEIKEPFYIKKSWQILNEIVPFKSPSFPKKHYFDHEKHFDIKSFKKDLPLYSPVIQKVMESIRIDDEEDSKNNRPPGKIFIYCEDVYSIRAMAGALVSDGWTFGMEKKKVKWTKQYISELSGKVLKKEQSKTNQVTWIPSTTEGKDYKRFLILTKSKLGGISGASLNEFAIQLIGSKDHSNATYNHPENNFGKDYRIIIIDKNFIEGMDLPSVYAHFVDPVLSSSTRTQIVGRISRFCGSQDQPFISEYGWPQKVYRYNLKFHTCGLHMSDSQNAKLSEKIRNDTSPYRSIIPKDFEDGFLMKLEKDLFSPLEIRILLGDDLNLQRLRKVSLEAFDAMMQQVSIGQLLYVPAMQNYIKSKQILSRLLDDEEETAIEYKQNVLEMDKHRFGEKSNFQMVLRSQQNADFLSHVDDETSNIVSILTVFVDKAIPPNTASSRIINAWDNNSTKINNFISSVQTQLLSDFNYVSIQPQLIDSVLRDMIKVRINKLKEKLEIQENQRLMNQQEKEKDVIYIYMKKQVQKLKNKSIPEIIEELHQAVPMEKMQLFRELWNIGSIQKIIEQILLDLQPSNELVFARELKKSLKEIRTTYPEIKDIDEITKKLLENTNLPKTKKTRQEIKKLVENELNRIEKIKKHFAEKKEIIFADNEKKKKENNDKTKKKRHFTPEVDTMNMIWKKIVAEKYKGKPTNIKEDDLTIIIMEIEKETKIEHKKVKTFVIRKFQRAEKIKEAHKKRHKKSTI